MIKDVKIASSWKQQLNNEFQKPYFQQLVSFVKDEYRTQKIYPLGTKIFSAFNECSFDDVKVVIVGQDPYHGAGQAHGLCFSVPKGIMQPPSLQNIFKEISSDLGSEKPKDGNLSRWAEQGILLLNSVLTVRASSPNSHQNRGWEEFTNAVLKVLSDRKKSLVFLLWGAYAQKKGNMVNTSQHYVLKAAHPSPFSANSGFFGCKHFSKTNQFLLSKGLSPIDW